MKVYLVITNTWILRKLLLLYTFLFFIRYSEEITQGNITWEGTPPDGLTNGQLSDQTVKALECNV